METAICLIGLDSIQDQQHQSHEHVPILKELSHFNSSSTTTWPLVQKSGIHGILQGEKYEYYIGRISEEIRPHSELRVDWILQPVLCVVLATVLNTNSCKFQVIQWGAKNTVTWMLMVTWMTWKWSHRMARSVLWPSLSICTAHANMILCWFVLCFSGRIQLHNCSGIDGNIYVTVIHRRGTIMYSPSDMCS